MASEHRTEKPPASWVLSLVSSSAQRRHALLAGKLTGRSGNANKTHSIRRQSPTLRSIVLHGHHQDAEKEAYRGACKYKERNRHFSNSRLNF